MTVSSAISMKNDDGNLSQRSGSSDGSGNKRAMKSNIALKNKQHQIQNKECKYKIPYLIGIIFSN